MLFATLSFIVNSSDRLSQASGIPAVFTGMECLLIAVIFFFPILFEYKFSVYAKRSIQNSRSAEFAAALRYLRKHYMYVAVLTSVVIVGSVAVSMYFAVSR